MAKNSSSSSASSVIIVGSNSDILRQILLCLPVKSLLVFKSVSTQWLSLISDPFFVRCHALRNKSLPIPGLFLRKYVPISITGPEFELVNLDGHVNASDVPWLIMPFEEGDPVYRHMIQSCNGLICFRCLRFSKESRGKCNLYYSISNPSTKHIDIFPKPPSGDKSVRHVANVSLAFDPIKSPHYEIVYISYVPKGRYEIRDNYYQIEIYSAETKSWRVSGNAFPAHHDTWAYSGVFWNGSLHWISSILEEASCLYFDVERELLKTLPMPPVPDGRDKRNTKYFGECGSYLYLIESYEPSSTCFDILVMDTDYTGWTLKYRLDLTEVTVAYAEMVHDNINVNDEFLGRFDFFILLVEEGEERLSRLLVQISDKLVSYDLHKKSFKVTRVLSPEFYGKDFTHDRYRFAHKYIESLASVSVLDPSLVNSTQNSTA